MRTRLFLGSLALFCLACTSTAPTKDRERRVRRYDGPVIDLGARALATGATNEEELFKKNASDPHLTRISAIVTASQGRLDETRALNEHAFRLAREDKKIMAVPSVHPYDGGAADEVGRLADAGALMIQLDVRIQGIDLADPRVGNVMQRAGERGVIVRIASGIADPTLLPKIVVLAERHPATQIVVEAMGGLTSFQNAAVFVELRKRPAFADNVWFDLSGTAILYSGSPYAEQLVWVIRKLSKHVLFGSGYPYDSSSQAIDAVQRLGLEENEQSDVLYANASRLLRLAP